MSKRNWVASLVAGAALLVVPALASATTILDTSSPTYLGTFNPGEPSDPTSEAGYINTLVDLAPNASTSDGSQTYTRSSNTLCYSTCPDATGTDSVTGTQGVNTGDFGSGYTYLLAKYDGPNGGDLVWYVAGLTGDFQLPATWGPADKEYGISHWALFDPQGSNVPEPASLLLLGTGVVAFARRRRLFGIGA
jgi:PEP-CTERM motif-containing protein